MRTGDRRYLPCQSGVKEVIVMEVLLLDEDTRLALVRLRNGLSFTVPATALYHSEKSAEWMQRVVTGGPVSAAQ